MSCIYPLLGSKLNRWSFVATDISTATVQCATANVLRNNLQDYIKGKERIASMIFAAFQSCLGFLSLKPYLML